jgi:hypothetical protein
VAEDFGSSINELEASSARLVKSLATGLVASSAASSITCLVTDLEASSVDSLITNPASRLEDLTSSISSKFTSHITRQAPNFPSPSDQNSPTFNHSKEDDEEGS